MIEEIKLLPLEQQTASAIDVAACHFGPGHDWVDVTSVASFKKRYQCRICGARGRANDRD